jgi:hypothetical protein
MSAVTVNFKNDKFDHFRIPTTFNIISVTIITFKCVNSPSLGVIGTQQLQSVWLVGQVAVGWRHLGFLVSDLLQQILAVSLPEHDQTRLLHASHCLHSETEQEMTHQFCLTFQCWTWCSGQS